MIWICRAGKKAVYFNKFRSESKIFLSWEDYNYNLTGISDIKPLKEIVIKEKGAIAKTSLSNWSSQLLTFCSTMQIGDFVIIPHNASHKYDLAKIVGEYEYCKNDELHHSRKIEFICQDIPRELFSQSLNYSLGAYRTIFKLKQEEEFLEIVNKYKDSVK